MTYECYLEGNKHFQVTFQGTIVDDDFIISEKWRDEPMCHM